MSSLKKGSQHPITIEKLVYQGWGLGRINNTVVFVPNGLPGDSLIVEIKERKKRHLMAKIVEKVQESSFRGRSACIHFPSCGGCQLIDVPYAKQLELKESILRDCFEGKNEALNSKLKTIIPSPNAEFYRNKMDFAFCLQNNKIQLGLKARG